MSFFSPRPGTNTSTEGALLTALNNLATGGAGTAIQKTTPTTFSNITVGGSGSDAKIANSSGDFSKASTAFAAAPAGGSTYFMTVGTITETNPVIVAQNAMELNMSNGGILQVDGSVVSPFIKPSTTGLARTILHGGKLLQTNATAQGVAINLSDMPNSWLNDMRIENFGTAIQIIDVASTSFYSTIQNIQIFDCNNGVSLGGSQPNLNCWINVRVRPKAGGAGTAWNLVDTRGNVLIMPDAEPATGTGITGFHLDATTRDNLFLGIWAENSDNNVVIDAGATNNIFIGGTITGAGVANITDNGTGTVFWGTNLQGTQLFKVPMITDVLGNEIITFSTVASAINQITFLNAAVNNEPEMQASGDDANVGITLTPKGSRGQVRSNIGTLLTAWTGAMATAVANKTIANTGTETTLFGTLEAAATKTLPANFLQIGKSIRITICGIYSTTAAPTLDIKVKLGSTIILDTTVDTAATTVTNQQFELTAIITCQTIGGTGTVIGQGVFVNNSTSITASSWAMTNTATTTIDTTTTQVIDVTATWGTASTSNTITATNAIIEIMGQLTS